MSVLLQISDPHFGTEQAPVMQALEQLVRAQRPELVVLSGDITQRATRAQFRAARAFVDRLGAPAVLAIPGNHDIPLFALGTRLLDPYGRYREAFGPELEPVFESAHCLVIAVNTTRWYRHEDGEVSAAQIERVAARLAGAAAQQLRVVVVHQPLAVTLARGCEEPPAWARCCGAALGRGRGGSGARRAHPPAFRAAAARGLSRLHASRCGRCRPARRCPRGCAAGHRTRST